MHTIGALNAEISTLEAELSDTTEKHPDAEILRNLPGLGVVLGARAIGEFGDDRTRYQNAKARRNRAGTSPVTKASGTRKVVLARYVRNHRLANTAQLWAFSALRRSPGARRYYDVRRKRGQTHNQALRALANRLIGILHGCLAHHAVYSESVARRTPDDETAVA